MHIKPKQKLCEMLNAELPSKLAQMRKTKKKHYVDIKYHDVKIKKRELIEESLTGYLCQCLHFCD